MINLHTIRNKSAWCDLTVSLLFFKSDALFNLNCQDLWWNDIFGVVHGVDECVCQLRGARGLCKVRLPSSSSSLCPGRKSQDRGAPRPGAWEDTGRSLHPLVSHSNSSVRACTRATCAHMHTPVHKLTLLHSFHTHPPITGRWGDSDLLWRLSRGSPSPARPSAASRFSPAARRSAAESERLQTARSTRRPKKQTEIITVSAVTLKQVPFSGYIRGFWPLGRPQQAHFKMKTVSEWLWYK